MLLTHFGVEFDEVGVALFTVGFEKELKKYSPTQKVPVLLDSGVEIWDSLAICEYLSEQYLQNRGWPSNVLARASCRAVSSEMHSGFSGIRADLPMNCRAKRQLEISEKTMKEVRRIDELWSCALLASGGPYLYGEFSIADCMFAPVVSRFSTYQLSLSPSARLYSATMLKNPAFQAWVDSAKSDTQIIDICEVGQELAD